MINSQCLFNNDICRQEEEEEANSFPRDKLKEEREF